MWPLRERAMTDTIAALAARWREDAELLEAYGDERGAAACRLHAGQLEAAVREAADAPLTLAEAAQESGYSAERLRHMLSAGDLPQAGRKGAPRVRRADLPRKKLRADGAAFDAAAVARRLITPGA
jgi:hypothetical protein